MINLSASDITIIVLLVASMVVGIAAAMRPRFPGAVALDDRTKQQLRAMVEDVVARRRLQMADIEALFEQVVAQKLEEAFPKPEPEPAAAAATAVEAPAAQPAAAGAGQVPYRVHLQGQVFDLLVNQGENLLHAALDRNVELDFSCLEGNCDSCQVKVLKGREFLSPITRQERDMLDEEDLKEGQRLACMVTIQGAGPIEIQQG